MKAKTTEERREEAEYAEARGWAEAAIEADGWASVLEEITLGERKFIEGRYAEAFIDLAEEKTGKKIRTVKDLETLPGLKKAEGLQAVLTEAGDSRYAKAIRAALNNGATLKKVLEIDPGALGYCGPDPEEEIAYCIHRWAGLQDTILLEPSLRAVAEALDAPYMELLAILKRNRA
jgi:hypothetical protein